MQTKKNEFIEQARAAGWSRKQTRSELYRLNDEALWGDRDAILEALGFAPSNAEHHKTQSRRDRERDEAQAKLRERLQSARGLAEAAGVEVAVVGRRTYIVGLNPIEQNCLSRDGWHADERGVWKGLGGTEQAILQAWSAAAEQVAQREQREARFEAAKQRSAEERAALESVEPHWPTWHRVKALCNDWNEACDALRHNDVKDYQFLHHAGGDLQQIAEMVMLDADHSVADILGRTVQEGRAMSAGQIKVVALVLAKLATANGMTGNEPVGPDTAHKQENVSRENEEIALPIVRGLKQRVSVTFTATKKTGKPYLAKLGPTFRDRTFAKGQKLTNTSKSFTFAGLESGDVIEFRGYNWSSASESYQGGVELALIGNGAIYFISRSTAREVVEGAETIMLDRVTPALRLSPDAVIPDDMARYDGPLRAWLTNEAGEPININWPEEDDDDDTDD